MDHEKCFVMVLIELKVKVQMELEVKVKVELIELLGEKVLYSMQIMKS